MRHPTKFAAAVPICGGADTSKAGLLKSLPIWNFHGGADPVVPVANSRLMMAALQKAGGAPKYTEYPGVGHDSWVLALQEPGLLPWLFAQKRSSSTSIPPNKIELSLIGLQHATRYRLDGRRFGSPHK